MPKKAASKPDKKAAPKAAAKKTAKPAATSKPLKAAKPAAKEKKASKTAAPAKAVKPLKAAKLAPAPPPKAAPAPKAVPAKASKTSKSGPKKGRGRVTSPSGPLSTAVVSVLKRARRPLNCAQITEALIKKEYQFTHPEPKRIVSIRIYKLKGVKQTGPALFTAAE